MALLTHLSLVLFLVGLVWTSFSLPHEGLYRLDIVHYNDFHARYEETSVLTPTCRSNNDSCLGGFPRLYHEVQVLLKEKPSAILLNAGDSFQGTYWFTLFSWNITQRVMNLLPHDAHGVGNHEFDNGPKEAALYFEKLKAPVLAANMDSKKEPSLIDKYQNHTIVERNGRKIGIIGVTTVDTAHLSSPGEVRFTDPGEAVAEEAVKLTEQGVDIIVLLSHCGLVVDKQLARDYGQYIDVIIGGHTHSLLWNGPAPSGEEVAGPYPVFVESSANTHHKVLIVQASAFTKYIGNLSVYFDYKGDYVNWEGGPIFLNRSIPEDKDIKEILAPIAEEVHRAENEVVGSTLRTMNYDDCVRGECVLGDLLVDSMNDAVTNYSATDNNIAIMQRGNIKSSIPQGNITKGVILELLPYRDRVEQRAVRGEDILLALERSVSEAWSLEPFKGPWLLQISGLRVSYNMSKPEGQRVSSVVITGWKKDGTPRSLDKDVLYSVTAPAYLINGGDGFTMFKNSETKQIVGIDQDIVKRYIKLLSPLNMDTDGRIIINY